MTKHNDPEMRNTFNKHVEIIKNSFDIPANCNSWSEIEKTVKENLITPTYREFLARYFAEIIEDNLIRASEKEIKEVFADHPHDIKAINDKLHLTLLHDDYLIDYLAISLFWP